MPKPILDLFVLTGCSTCSRAIGVVEQCRELNQLVEVVVTDVGEPGESTPDTLVGVPTAIFRGRVVALGTPDCTDLVETIAGLLETESREQNAVR